MWVLRLNPMRGRSEEVRLVARAPTKEHLETFLKAETVERYSDGTWNKVYRQGGPLEWYNPPMPGHNGEMEAWINVPAFTDIGTPEDWARGAIEDYERLTTPLFEAGYPLQCVDCKTIVYLPYRYIEGEERVSIADANNWTAPPNRCPDCSKKVGKSS